METLCMPFPVFHEAMEYALGRKVFMHEFGFCADPDGLKRELFGERSIPSEGEVLKLIPDKYQAILTVAKN
jgi:hypothetical protein